MEQKNPGEIKVGNKYALKHLVVDIERDLKGRSL